MDKSFMQSLLFSHLFNIFRVHMSYTKRYTFWKVFRVVAIIITCFFIIGILGLMALPVQVTGKYWNQVFGARKLITEGCSLLFYSYYYYYSVNAYYRLIQNRKQFSDYIAPSFIAILMLTAYNIFSYFFLDKSGIGVAVGDVNAAHMVGKLPGSVFVFAYGFATIFLLGFSLLIAYLTYLRDERKQRKILEEQKLQLEMEKSQANLNFLKAQINPHFLHNTLNFLYAKSLPYSPELSEGILTLSDIMRYALNEAYAKDGKAPLKDEIEHVRNVIKINQLRFSNNLNVNFQVEGVVNGALIIPFVLITIVENAFKHGDLKNTEHPIDILLKVNGSELYFSCSNRKKAGPKELSTGIGLDNIKKRLDLAYGNNYALNIKDEADFYTTELIIHRL